MLASSAVRQTENNEPILEYTHRFLRHTHPRTHPIKVLGRHDRRQQYQGCAHHCRHDVAEPPGPRNNGVAHVMTGNCMLAAGPADRREQWNHFGIAERRARPGRSHFRSEVGMWVARAGHYTYSAVPLPYVTLHFRHGTA